MKRIITLSVVIIMATLVLVGCSMNKGKDDIHTISRENGSGTRSAFVELFGIEEKNENGNKKDKTTQEAIIANKTNIMLGNVESNPQAIGYVSMGSLNDEVKTVKINHIEPTAENIRSGEYEIYRPFVIATRGEAKGISKDFISYIMSKEGQKIVSSQYIAIDENAKEYNGKELDGKITVAGSSSVTPIMEKLIEGYSKVNPYVTIELQQSDSTTGIQGTIDGTCDIGMSSRDLDEKEEAKLIPIDIGLDGIAVIINKANPVKGLTKEEVRNIFIGKTTKWSEIEK